MAVNKFFDQPRCHDRAFYAPRDAADHISSRHSCLRIHLAAGYVGYVVKFEKPKSVGDFGCGTGGLMYCLRQLFAPPPIRLYGYDLCPANVAWACERGLDVVVRDFVNEEVEWPELLVMTETLEHLLDPPAFVQKIPTGTHVVFTVPNADDGKKHDHTHLWGWTEESFPEMLKENGIDVQRWDPEMAQSFQVVLGVKL